MDFKQKMTRKLGRIQLWGKKNSSDIFMGLGIASLAISFGLTIKATIKAGDILEVHGAKMRDIQDEVEKTEAEPEKYEYPEDLVKHDKARVYAKTGLMLTKAYAPAFAMATVGVGCIITSRNILQKRYLAAVAAYNTVTTAFSTYRGRVIEEKGEMWDRHYMYGTKIEEVTETVIDPETGKKKKVKKEVEVFDTDDFLESDTSRLFDERNPNWSRQNLLNRAFLNAQQNALTDLLNDRGHLFLNEAYDFLGFDHTTEGSILGWIIDEDEIGIVDIGIFEFNRPEVKSFAEGDVNEILLEFRQADGKPIGVIFDKI